MQGDMYGCALQAVSRSGHEVVVWLFLEQYEDVNMQEGGMAAPSRPCQLMVMR